MQLVVGDMIFYKSNTLMGKIIGRLTKSEYSHVAMYVGDNKIVEADRFIKSRITDFVVEDKKLVKIMRYKHQLTNEQRTEILVNLDNVVGLTYDYLTIFYLFLKLAFSVDTTNTVNDLNKFICSELVDYVYYTVGVDLVPDVETHSVTPADLVKSPMLIGL